MNQTIQLQAQQSFLEKFAKKTITEKSIPDFKITERTTDECVFIIIIIIDWTFHIYFGATNNYVCDYNEKLVVYSEARNKYKMIVIATFLLKMSDDWLIDYWSLTTDAVFSSTNLSILALLFCTKFFFFKLKVISPTKENYSYMSH